jgi:uncharacterized membrane protein
MKKKYFYLLIAIIGFAFGLFIASREYNITNQLLSMVGAGVFVYYFILFLEYEKETIRR